MLASTCQAHISYFGLIIERVLREVLFLFTTSICVFFHIRKLIFKL